MNETILKSKLSECPICFEPIYPMNEATLKCDHKLHKTCLARWSGDPKNNPSDRNKTCPVCRGPLELKVKEDMIRRQIGGYQKKKTRKLKKFKKSRKSRKQMRLKYKTRK
jgi:hypothetical protein